MDTAIWIIQGLLATALLAAGVATLTGRAGTAAPPGLAWTVGPDSAGQATIVGALEILLACGLILPAALGLVPFLTGAAALGVLVLVFEAALVQILRGEGWTLAVNLIVGALALLVVIDRLGAHRLL